MESLALQPTNEPTEADCRDALEKGLGRARLWAEAGLLSLTELRRACVKDLRYDQQCEDNRADWIWTLLNASKSVDACEDDLWQATADRSAVDRNASHICRLAMKYGQSGRNRFVDQLYALVRNRPEDSDDLTLGEFELISVAGLDGVLVAAKKRGEQLRQTGEDWGDFQLIANATDLYSESAVVEALAASLDKDVQRFFESWRSSLESKGGKVGRESPRQRNSGKAANVDEVLRAAKMDAHCFWLQRWGLRAALDDVSKVLEQILRCEDPDELSRLLRVFALRKLPRIDPVLFQHCRSTHASLNFTALRALRGNTAPSIRAFALECLNDGDTGCAVELLATNYRAGDERVIADALVIPSDPDECHGLLMACRSFLEANVQAESDRIAQLLYRHTPCSLCRSAAVKILRQQGRIPVWMQNEALYDCDEETRKLFS